MEVKIGKTERWIYDSLDDKGALMFTVIDPLDYRSPDDAIKTAGEATKAGTDAILLGGSTGAQGELLDYVGKGIKESTDIPLILFPGNIATVTKHADAIYFLSMLNSRNPYWITQAQTIGAPVVRYLGIEPLPVGYIVVEPGGTVGWIGDANMVPRKKPKIAAALALAGEYMGHRFITTDTGSNPQLYGSGPVPPEIIREVRKAINVTYIVAGGMRSETDIKNAIGNGADILQIGTAIEKSKNPFTATKFFSSVVRREGLKRKKER